MPDYPDSYDRNNKIHYSLNEQRNANKNCHCQAAFIRKYRHQRTDNAGTDSSCQNEPPLSQSELPCIGSDTESEQAVSQYSKAK